MISQRGTSKRKLIHYTKFRVPQDSIVVVWGILERRIIGLNVEVASLPVRRFGRMPDDNVVARVHLDRVETVTLPMKRGQFFKHMNVSVTPASAAITMSVTAIRNDPFKNWLIAASRRQEYAVTSRSIGNQSLVSSRKYDS